MTQNKARVAVYLLGLGPGAAWLAFVSSLLWSWFAVPIGAPVISFRYAIGICELVCLLRTNMVAPIDTDDKRPGWEIVIDYVITAFTAPALAMLAGWIYQSLPW